MSKPNEAQRNWLEKLAAMGGGGGAVATLLADPPANESGPTVGGTSKPVLSNVSGDSRVTAAGADERQPTPPREPGRPAKAAGTLSQQAVRMLVENLTYLGNPSFLDGPYAPPKLQTASEPAVDKLLGQVAEVLKLWNDPKTLPQAQKLWKQVQPQLSSLLKQAEGANLGFQPQFLKPARDAIANISDRLAKRASRGAATPQPKGQAPKGPEKLADSTVTRFVENIAYLAHPSFLKAGYAPKELNSTTNAAMDKLVNQAAQVVRLWNDAKTLPQAHKNWNETKPQLLKLLAKLEGADYGYKREVLQPARDAIAKISEFLIKRNAYFGLKEAEQAEETPDVGEAFGLREVAKFEPTLILLKDANKQLGLLATKDSALAKASKVVKIYFSVTKMSEKLQAFKDQGLLGKAATAVDLAAFLAGVTKDAMEGYTKAAIILAEKAGNKALVKALGERLKVLKSVTRVLAVYDAIKSTVELISAIKKGDPRAIADAARNVAIAGIGVAETAGVITAGGSAAAAGVVFLIWVEVDMIMGVAELHRWSKHVRALKAVKRMMDDARRIVPYGKKMAAAAKLMIAAQVEGKPEFDSYQKQAFALAVPVAKALRVLADNHFERDDLDSVGGYKELVKALGQPARQMLGQAFMGTIPDDPMSLSDAFKTILQGVKSMVTEGNKLYGDGATGL